jgi:transcriptional regulator with XRE-family HTH domain
MDETQARELGQYLKTNRESAGYSVRRLAAEVGVDQAQILRLEAGLVASPKADVLGQIAELLAVPVADLYAMAGYPVPTKLPNLRPYMRAKFASLPTEAIADIEAVIARYSGPGPTNGEDEREATQSPTRHPK